MYSSHVCMQVTLTTCTMILASTNKKNMLVHIQHDATAAHCQHIHLPPKHLPQRIFTLRKGLAHLFDGNGDSDGVDGPFNLYSLLLITTDHHWSQQQLLATSVDVRGPGPPLRHTSNHRSDHALQYSYRHNYSQGTILFSTVIMGSWA